MGIAAPTQLATINSNTSAQTAWTTASITFPAGTLAVMEISTSGSAVNAGFTVADGGGTGTAWTVVSEANNNGGAAGVHSAIAYHYYASATTTTVKASFPSCNMRFGWCGYTSGTDTAPGDAVGAANPGAATSITVTTSTNLAVDGEIGFVGVSLQSNGAGNPTTWPTSGFTSLFNPTDGTRGRAAAFEYQILTTGSGATLSSGSIPYTTSSVAAASIATFQPAASGGGSPQTVTMTGLGTASDTGSVTAVPGAVTATMTGLASASSFGTTTALPGGVNVPVNGLASAASFGSPGEATGPVSVPVTGLGSAGAFGTIGSPAAPTEHFDPAIHGGKHR